MLSLETKREGRAWKGIGRKGKESPKKKEMEMEMKERNGFDYDFISPYCYIHSCIHCLALSCLVLPLFLALDRTPTALSWFDLNLNLNLEVEPELELEQPPRKKLDNDMTR